MNTISQTDELLLVDDIQGRLDRKESEALKDRMATHPELRKLRTELAATLAALEVATATRAPHGLSGRTLDHIATVQRTNALLAIQESRSRRRSSFSFRELAAIAAVLVVMLGLIIPSLRIARQHRDEGLCAAQLGQIGVGLNTYAMNHEGNLPAPPDGKPSRWMDAKEGKCNASALFTLLRQRHVSRPMVFQCPAAEGDSFEVGPGMKRFPQANHISYSYQHSFGPHRARLNLPRASEIVILADANPLFEGGVFHADRVDIPVSRNHGQRGQNVLFLDGHTKWTHTANAGVDGDNIYLLRGKRTYQGTEAPESTLDTFLLPAYVK